MSSLIVTTTGASIALALAVCGSVLAAGQATEPWGFLLMAVAGVAFVRSRQGCPGVLDRSDIAERAGDRRKPSGGWLGIVPAVLLNVAGLVVWARAGNPNLAWALYLASLLAVLLSAWFLAGRPWPRLGWPKQELCIVLALLALAAGLRLFDLTEQPFGLWWDEAYSGLAIKRIITNWSYRPVYEAGAAEEPALYWYVTALFVLAGGTTPVALRLGSALAGTLGVMSTYLLAREIGGRRYAFVAAALLALLVWHLNFSRIAFNAIWSVTLDALAAYFFLRALRRRNSAEALLGGLFLGLGLQMYYTSRLLPIVLAVYLAYRLVASGRGSLGRWWRPLLWYGVSAAIGVSPLALFAVLHPAEFFARMSNVTIFGERGPAGSVTPLLTSLFKYLQMFHAAGDTNGRHNLPGWPVLDPITGGLFIVGLIYCLARVRRPSAFLLVAWVPIMLIGGVFSIDAPNSLRCVDEVTAVALLAAWPVTELWQDWTSLISQSRLPRGLMISLPTAAVVLVLLFVGGLNADRYFNRMKYNPEVLRDYSAAETVIAHDVDGLPSGTRVFLDEAYFEHPTIRLLAPDLRQHRRFDFAEVPFSEGRDVLVYFSPGSFDSLTALWEAYPQATVLEWRAPYRLGVLFYSVRIPFGL